MKESESAKLLLRLRKMWDEPFRALNGSRKPDENGYMNYDKKLQNGYKWLDEQGMIFMWGNVGNAVPDLRHPFTKEVLPQLWDSYIELEELLGFSLHGKSFNHKDGDEWTDTARRLVCDGIYYIDSSVSWGDNAKPYDHHPLVKSFFDNRDEKRRVWEKYHRADYEKQCAAEREERERRNRACEMLALDEEARRVINGGRPFSELSADQKMIVRNSLSDKRYPELWDAEVSRNTQRRYQQEMDIVRSERSIFDEPGSWKAREQRVKDNFNK